MSTDNKFTPVIVPAKIKSAYYITNNANESSYSTVTSAWISLINYVSKTSAINDIIQFDQENKKIHIIRADRNLSSLTSSYIPIKDPVILDPLSANIKG